MKIQRQTTNIVGAIVCAGLLTAVSIRTASADAAVNVASASAPAEALLSQAAQKLQSSTSLTADFEEIDSYPTRYKDLAQRGNLVLARPNLLLIDIHRFRRVSSADPWNPSGNDTEAVSDGKTYSFAFLHPHSTQVKQSTAEVGVLTGELRSIPPVSTFFTVNPSSVLAEEPGTATLLAPASWEGKTYQVVQYTVASSRDVEPTALAYVGSDLLIHHLVYRYGTPLGTATKEWNLRNITLNQTEPASLFAYVPPPDATPLDNSPKGEMLSPGSAAPDFTAYDSKGNPVHLSDFKGKTVVLDFWATWCWPCNQSLPHTEQVASEYKDKGVVTLAVAIWDSKAGFDAWLPKHNYPDIDFVIDPRPQGQDAASSLYHVGTTPTAYVIDSSGKVVTSIPGFSGPTDDLEVALESVQSSKSASAR